MQTYQSTPDYYRDYIEHGYLKDQAAKVHKYLKRWKNDAGKWVYQYANKAKGAYYRNKSKWQENETKIVRRKLGIKDPETITVGAKRRIYPMVTKYSIKSKYTGNSGKANSRSGQAGSNRNRKIGTGLRERGYSSSFGSATSFGNHVTNRNWRQDRDAQNWADVYSGRKTFDQYKKTSRWDDSQSSGSMRDVRAGIYAGRKRRRKKK